jgi:hypothetical protein
MARRGPRTPGRILPLLLVLGWTAASVHADADGPHRYAGRDLVEVLSDLRARGLNLIYSSDLIRPGMVVTVEPTARSPRRVLDQVLAPFDLASLDGPGPTVLIVRSAETADRDEGGTGPAPPRPMLREAVKVRSASADDPAGRGDPWTTLDAEAVRETPQIGDDPSRALSLMPGVAAGDKTAAFNIRGGEPGDTQFILDGLTIDDTLHLKDFLGFSSIIDSRTLGSVEMLTGAFPAEYGGRMGGVVNLTSRQPAGPPRTAVNVSTVNAGFLSEGASGDGETRWLVSTRAWRPDAVVDIVDPGGEGLNPSYYDLYAKAERTLGDGTVLSGHILAARDTVDAPTSPDGGRVTADGASHYAWLRLQSMWTARLYSSTVLSTGRGSRARQGAFGGASDGSGLVSDDRSFATDTLAQDWMFQASDRVGSRWGFLARRVAAEYDYASHVENVDPLLTGGVPVVADNAARLAPSGTEFGAWLSERLQPVPWFTVEAGARWDRQTLTAQDEVSPRVAMSFVPGPRSALRLGWGVVHQPQGPREIQVEDGVVAPAPAERAEVVTIDFGHAFAPGLTLGLGAYSKRLENLRPRYENLFDPMVLFPETRADRVLVTAARARARGVELTLAGDRGGAFSWWTGYTLASAEDEIDGRMVPRSWDQRHTFKMVARYRRGARWDFAVAGQYHSGWPTTAISATAVAGPDGSLAVQPALGPRNDGDYPAFHRLDLLVNRRFDFKDGTLGLLLQVTNLYGRHNVCCVSEVGYLPQPDGTVVVDRDEGHWLRPLPVFGLTWEFRP